jgi:hypothetical protein
VQDTLVPIFRALISLLTLFGGHFLNRRLDRVVLIGAVLMFMAVAYLVTPLAVLTLTGTFPVQVAIVLSFLPMLLAAVALASAIQTFFDARAVPLPPLTLTMRVTGAALSVIGSFLLLGLLLARISTPFSGPVTVRDTSTTGSQSNAPPLSSSIHYGGNVREWELPAPPPGAGRLRGRITVDGDRGAEGVTLYVVLNAKYRADELTTDAQGFFEIPVPPGTWYVNHVSVESWAKQPDSRKLELFTLNEAAKTSGVYSRSHFVGPNGLEVVVTDSPDAVAVSYELREAITMTWPLGRNDPFPLRDGERAERAADLQTSAVTWPPVKSAAEYQVQISRVTRRGTTTSFHPAITRSVKVPKLPLADLPQKDAETDVPTEYAVEVYAFDAENRLLSESGDFIGSHVFTLAGPKRLGVDDQGENPSEELVLNSLRLNRAERLLDERKLEEARVLLAEISGDAPLGKESALRGKLAALEGDCATATLLFDKAEMEGGPGCVPLEDRQLCVIQRKQGAR